MFEFINDIGNYESRVVGRVDHVEGEQVGVSTAYTSDEGYETAILDKNAVYPVERYKNIEDSIIGHAKWVDFAKDGNGKTITKLGGFCGLIDAEQVTIEM